MIDRINELGTEYGNNPNVITKQKIINNFHEAFDRMLEEADLVQYQYGIYQMPLESIKDWLWNCCEKRIELEVEKRTFAKKGIPLWNQVKQQYQYDQRAEIVDYLALQYVNGQKKDRFLRIQLWEEAYKLFPFIQYFQGLEKYHTLYFRGYNSPEEWMQMIFNDTILYCMNRYDPLIKASFSGYLVDYYRKYRIKDAIKELATRDQHEKLMDMKDVVLIQPKMEEDTTTSGTVNAFLERALTLITQLYIKKQRNYESVSSTLKKADYYRLFYTEQIIQLVKYADENQVTANELNHEQEVFLTLNDEFLDYLMKELCRTYFELIGSPLKANDQILHDGDFREIKLPVNQKIFYRFCNDILDICRSQESLAASMSKYRNMFQKQIQEMYK